MPVEFELRFKKPNSSGVKLAECSLIIGTGCWIQVFGLILDSSVGLSAGIKSAGDSVPKTLVQILHSAEEDNWSPFDLKIVCLCQSIKINNKHVCIATISIYTPNMGMITYTCFIQI